MYTQHVPLLISTLKDSFGGRLQKDKFPSAGPIPTAPPKYILVFVIGGVTYEEGTKVAELNRSGPAKVILGGTSVCNSKNFLRGLWGM